MAAAERNSVIVKPTPASSHTVRNGRSVTAAMGASSTGVSICSGPTRITKKKCTLDQDALRRKYGPPASHAQGGHPGRDARDADRRLPHRARRRHRVYETAID